MTPSTSVIWTRGPVGMTGTILPLDDPEIAALGLVLVDTEFGQYHEYPFNLSPQSVLSANAVEGLKARFWTGIAGLAGRK